MGRKVLKSKLETKNQKKIQESSQDVKTSTKSLISSTKFSKAKESSSIVDCFWKCSNVPNIGLVKVMCTASCAIKFHSQCWKVFATVSNKKEEAFLNSDCLSESCLGVINSILYMDK